MALDLELAWQAPNQDRYPSEAAHCRRPVRGHRAFERVIVAAVRAAHVDEERVVGPVEGEHGSVDGPPRLLDLR